MLALIQFLKQNLYNKAAIKYDVNRQAAKVALGKMYLSGEGVSSHFLEALALIKPAAKQGNPRAQNLIGFMYFNGQG